MALNRPAARGTSVEGGGWARGLTADLTPAAVAELALEPVVTLSVKAATVAVHPAAAS